MTAVPGVHSPKLGLARRAASIVSCSPGREVEESFMGQMRFYAPTPDALLPHAVAQAYIAGIEAIPWHSCNRWTDGMLVPGTRRVGIGQPAHSLGRAGPRPAGALHLHVDGAAGAVPSGHGAGPRHTASSPDAGGRSRVRGRADPGQHPRGTPAGAVARSFARRPCRPRQTLRRCRRSASPRCDRRHLPAMSSSSKSDSSARPTVRCPRCWSVGWAISPGRRSRPYGRSSTRSTPRACPCAGATCSRPRNCPVRICSMRSWPGADQHELRLLGGPLIQLDRSSLPDWVCRWENRYEAFEDAARKYVRGVVQRYDEAVDVWVCAGRLNVAGALGFSEEQRLRSGRGHDRSGARNVVAHAGRDQFRSAVGRVPGRRRLRPVAAAFRRRAGPRRTGCGRRSRLEMNLGYWPGGCLPRDLLAISRHLDRWSLLGIPLIVYLTMPSSAEHDPQAVGQAQVVHRDGSGRSTPAMDQSLAGHLIPLLLSKPALHAVVWNQLSDAEPHEFPHSGVLDHAGNAKPLLSVLAGIRKRTARVARAARHPDPRTR